MLLKIELAHHVTTLRVLARENDGMEPLYSIAVSTALLAPPELNLDRLCTD